MNNNQFFDLVMARLGGRTGTALRANAVLELNTLIDEYERSPTKPWFLETEASGNLTAGADLTLPSDFLMEVEEGVVRVQHSSEGWKALRKVTKESILLETANAANAFPEAYAIYGETFVFGPKPDSTYPYKFDYYSATTDVVDNTSAISNKWLLTFQPLMLSELVLVMASNHVHSAELVQKTTVGLQKLRREYEVECEARKHTNMEYLLTDEEN